MIRIRKRAVHLCLLSSVPTPSSDPATLSPVQLLASDDTEAVHNHSEPLDLHVLGPQFHGRTTLESPLVQVQNMAEVKPSLIDGAEKGEMEKMMQSIFEDGENERMKTKIGQNGNNYRYLSLSSFYVGANSDCKIQPPSSSSIQVVAEEKQPGVILTPPAGRWLDGDKNMPLKKRKVSFEMIMSQVDQGTKKMMVMSKINKKSSSLSVVSNSMNTVLEEDGEDKEGGEAADDNEHGKVLNKAKSNNIEVDDATDNKNTTIATIHKRTQLGSSEKKSKGKKGRETMLLMQGSRCSRVNGRGWRCSQPTLVAYSLCEHHLGKGRLIRNTTCCTINRSSPAHNDNIKRRSISPSSIIDPPPLSSPKSVKKKRNGDYDGRTTNDAFDCDQEEDEHMVISNEHTNSQSKKKRVKLGRMVKARSLSSLLGQLNAMVQLPPSANGICK